MVLIKCKSPSPLDPWNMCCDNTAVEMAFCAAGVLPQNNAYCTLLLASCLLPLPRKRTHVPPIATNLLFSCMCCKYCPDKLTVFLHIFSPFSINLLLILKAHYKNGRVFCTSMQKLISRFQKKKTWHSRTEHCNDLPKCGLGNFLESLCCWVFHTITNGVI